MGVGGGRESGRKRENYGALFYSEALVFVKAQALRMSKEPYRASDPSFSVENRNFADNPEYSRDSADTLVVSARRLAMDRSGPARS